MKKHLMATTALVAAGLLASAGPAVAQAKKASLTLGGFMQSWVSYTDLDKTVVPAGFDDVPFDVKSDGEVFFSGNLALDNGITLITRVELEAFSSNGSLPDDQIDENYINIRGSFGQVFLGGTDSVAWKMTVGYTGEWAVGVSGEAIDFTINNYFLRPAGHARQANSVGGAMSGDGQKISYITPRFGGFQAGASYMPNRTGAAPVQVADAGAAAVAGAPPGSFPLTAGGANSEDINTPNIESAAAVAARGPGSAFISTNDNEGFSFAANFDQTFGGFRVGVAGSYEFFKRTGGANPKEFTLAGSVESGPFKFAVGYWQLRKDGAGGAAVTNGEIYQAGGRYRWGPNAASATYMRQEMPGAAGGGDDESDIIYVSYARTLSPGAAWTSTFRYADYEDEGGVSGENWGVSSGIRIFF